MSEKKPRFFSDDRQTPARREARNHRSEDAKMLGPLPRGPQNTGRADQRGARGDPNRDRSTQNHRRPVLLCATQRPRSTNNETMTTTRHRELCDPRPTHLAVDLGNWGLRWLSGAEKCHCSSVVRSCSQFTVRDVGREGSDEVS